MAPSVDIKNNPFYCPAVPAHTFLSSLRRNRKNFRPKVHLYGGKPVLFRPFAAALDKCLFKGGGDSDDDKRTVQVQHESSDGELNDTFGGCFGAHIPTTGREFASALRRTGLKKNTDNSLGSDIFVTVPLAPTAKKIPCSGTATLCDRSGRPLVTIQRDRSLAPQTLTIWDKLSLPEPQAQTSPKLKRKSSESLFTFNSGTKRARSTLSIDDKSFYVTLRREKLRFAGTPSSSPLTASSQSSAFLPQTLLEGCSFEELRAGTRLSVPRLKDWHGPLDNIRDLDQQKSSELAAALQDELYGPRLGPETDIQELVKKLDFMLPGIRIKERLMERIKNGADLQGIVDFLGENGHLNANVLELFRASKITKISLSESFNDVNGLNLASDDSFFVFSKPNSFRSLTTLSLDRLCIKTPTLSHLQHLPKLAVLSLFDTGIDNRALYYLTSLEFTLMDLNIARNPAIDDDATLPLLQMTRLTYLSIAETSIGMPGARKLVNDCITTGRRLSIDFPHWCYDYVATMGTKYCVDLRPPLISNPSLCDRMSVAALKRNLAVHASVNKEVRTGGTKKDMVERLKALLEMRLADLEIRRQIENPAEAVRRHIGNNG